MEPKEAFSLLDQLEKRYASDQQIPISQLRALGRQIKQNDSLSVELWRLGREPGRILAILIANPQRVFDADLEEWIAEAPPRGLESLGSDLLARFNRAIDLVDQWDNTAPDSTLTVRHCTIVGLVVRRRIQTSKALEWIERELELLPRASERIVKTAVEAIEALGGVSVEANECAIKILSDYAAVAPASQKQAYERLIGRLKSIKVRARIGHYRPVTVPRQ